VRTSNGWRVASSGRRQRGCRSGAARGDVGFDDVCQLITGVAALNLVDEAQRERVLGMAFDGLRPLADRAEDPALPADGPVLIEPVEAALDHVAPLVGELLEHRRTPTSRAMTSTVGLPDRRWRS
jgi:hypothetical protein